MLQREMLSMCECVAEAVLQADECVKVPEDWYECEVPVSRPREVLHQFFKFGFEARLFTLQPRWLRVIEIC